MAGVRSREEVIHQKKVKNQPPAALCGCHNQPVRPRSTPSLRLVVAVECGRKPLKLLTLVANISSMTRRRNNSPRNETILGFWRRTPETPDGYQDRNKNGVKRHRTTGDCQMRTMSLIFAFAFVLAGSSMAGSAETGMPGIGTFSYNGSPVVTPHAVIVAAR
jgi:hypothetical protein